MEYARLTSPEVGALDKDRSVIVIPAAAIEQHGAHLSLKTDTVLAEAIARRAAEKATAEVLVTPTFWAGCSNHHMDFPGSLSLEQETFIRALTEIALCFVRHGFKKIFFLNGHGHNLSPLHLVARNVRDASDGDVIAATGNYWHFIPDDIRRIRESPMGGMAHAGEFETSAMLIEAPDQVHMDKAVRHIPRWKTPFFTMDLLASRPAYIAHHVSDFSPSGVFGDAAIGTAEKGEQFLDAAATRIAAFLDDYSGWTLETLYTLGDE